MASLTFIPYAPVPTKDRHGAKDASKPTNDYGKEQQIKLSTLSVDPPQLQATATSDNGSNLLTHDNEPPLEGRTTSASTLARSQNHACSQQYLDGNSSVSGDESGVVMSNLFTGGSLYNDSGDTEPTTETESNFGNPGIWDGIAEIESSGIGDTEIIRHPLKRKAKTRGQGSQDNPCVIPDGDSDSESDIESWDRLAWKKRKVRFGSRTIDETDNETGGAEFGIGSTRVRGDILSESDSASDVGNSEQAHPSPAALSAYHSALFESDDRVKAQSVARVGGNGEWGIHGIIGKEVIEGKVYYCVDWEPTMMPSDELLRAQGLVQEFEDKELKRADNRWKKGYYGQHWK